jgi:hypothetical protein
LPAGQQRSLSRIEKALADDHPCLRPLFAIFTGLAGHEAMPVTERVTARPRRARRMRSTLDTVFGMGMVTGVSPVTWPQKPAAGKSEEQTECGLGGGR